MPTRHEDCGLELNLAPDSSTSHESGCGIEKGRGWGSRQYKLPRNKSKCSKKGIADKVSYRLCREPVHRATGSEQSALDMAESFALIWSCKLRKTYRNLGWKSTLDPTTDRMSAEERTRHDAPKCESIKEIDKGAK